MALTWHARKTKIYKGPFGEIRKNIPSFRRAPFRTETGGMNQYLDIIVREPFMENQGALFPNDDEAHIPVATVSKQYQLVQHHEVLNALENVLNENSIDLACIESELRITEYGERMWFSFTLPTYGFDPEVPTYGFVPNDGYPVVLKVNILNSVDKTTALEIVLTWHRLVCSNGMIYGGDVDFRKIHLTTSLDYEAIVRFLKMQLNRERFLKQKQRVDKWQSTKVIVRKLTKIKPSPGQVEHWIDNVVAKKWGVHAASRIYHIAKTGYDGKVVKLFEKNVKPHEREVSSTNKVPGSYEYAPVRNAYDIAQVLSWFAGQRETIQQQLTWLMDIPYLMEALLKTEKPITLSIENN